MDDIKFLFDTDILIWVERGNKKAIQLVDETQVRAISVQTYLELLQGARTQQEQLYIKEFLTELDFEMLPLTENIGHRATIYIEKYALSNGLRAGDAIIAATAGENNCVLVSANRKHYQPIKEIRTKLFRP